MLNVKIFWRTANIPGFKQYEFLIYFYVWGFGYHIIFLWVFFRYFLPTIYSASGDSGQLVTRVYPFTFFNSHFCTCISQWIQNEIQVQIQCTKTVWILNILRYIFLFLKILVWYHFFGCFFRYFERGSPVQFSAQD